MAYEQLQVDILDELVDDWFDFAQLMYLAREYVGTSERSTAEATLAAVRELLQKGRIVAGDLGEDFQPWEQQGEAAASRISRYLQRALDEDGMVKIGDICWFALSDRG